MTCLASRTATDAVSSWRVSAMPLVSSVSDQIEASAGAEDGRKRQRAALAYMYMHEEHARLDHGDHGRT